MKDEKISISDDVLIELEISSETWSDLQIFAERNNRSLEVFAIEILEKTLMNYCRLAP